MKAIDEIAAEDYKIQKPSLQKALEKTIPSLKELTYSGKSRWQRTYLKAAYALGLINPVDELRKLGERVERRMEEDQEKIDSLDAKIDEIDMYLCGVDSEGNVVDEYSVRKMMNSAEVCVLGYALDLENKEEEKAEEKKEAERVKSAFHTSRSMREAFKTQLATQKEHLLLDKATLEGLDYDSKYMLVDNFDNGTIGITNKICEICVTSAGDHYDDLVKGLEKIGLKETVTNLTDPPEAFRGRRRPPHPRHPQRGYDFLKRNSESIIQLAMLRIAATEKAELIERTKMKPEDLDKIFSKYCPDVVSRTTT